MADLRNENWDSFIPLNDVNEAASIWTKAFLNIADKHAPMKQSRVKGNDVPWMSSALKDIMNERNRLYRKAIKSKNPVDWTKYKEVKNSVNTQIRKCKSDYYCNVIEESKSQPKSLWKHLNNITLRKPNSNVSSLLDDGKSYTLSQDIAQTLNLHFSTVGAKLTSKFNYGLSLIRNITYPLDTMQTEARFNLCKIDESFIKTQIRKLKTNKSTGLDGISVRLIKDSADVISKSLTNIFNLSLITSTFPSVWSVGKVKAVFKSGNRSDVNNYRPITILPVVSKLLEKAVYCQLNKFLTEQNLLTTKQFGFRPKLSTGTALAQFTDTVLDNMDKGCLTGAAFLDITKAFDTVSHDILICKLVGMGVSHTSVNWFSSIFRTVCKSQW